MDNRRGCDSAFNWQFTFEPAQVTAVNGYE